MSTKFTIHRQPPPDIAPPSLEEEWIRKEVIWLAKAFVLCTLGVLAARAINRGTKHFDANGNVMAEVMAALREAR